jgi:hypothetical protein
MATKSDESCGLRDFAVLIAPQRFRLVSYSRQPPTRCHDEGGTQMSQPVTESQLSDAERIAILDKKLAAILSNNNLNSKLESRTPFSAVVVQGAKPIKKSDWFWLAILTILSLGLGLVFVAIFVFLKYSKAHRVRLDVTPTGNITKTKLPLSGS